MTEPQKVMDISEYEDTQKDKFLTFYLGEEYYGLDIKYVTEIIGVIPTTKVPEMPDYVIGIVNLRGKIIPVMDVRMRFGKDFQEYNERTCIIVIDYEDISIGLIVDGVSDVVTILENEISQPPELNKANSRFTKGIGKYGEQIYMLLDCGRLLATDE